MRHLLCSRERAQPASGADGMKIAVLRKGRAGLEFIRAAAHRRRYIKPAAGRFISSNGSKIKSAGSGK